MAWAKGTIKLQAAKRIFKQFNIKEEKLGDKVVGYSAQINQSPITDTSLTNLCERIVETLLVPNS
ncbi:hypothetical protein Lepto7375DRAFT_1781 [Leptolyngbya sp. PCC 7375]|nr:hypothetical protein Lepto7375DRAFT_1781 [Leptolyngbya sp. PCC 7375]